MFNIQSCPELVAKRLELFFPVQEVSREHYFRTYSNIFNIRSRMKSEPLKFSPLWINNDPLPPLIMAALVSSIEISNFLFRE